MARTNHLICGSGPLLDDKGRLKEPGYALRPPFDYDHARITASPLRIKDWDYYLVNDEHRAVALTFSDLSYIGLISASVLDFDAGTYTTTSELVVLPFGRMGVPASSDKGDIVWRNKRCDVRFCHTATGRRLSFGMRGFRDKDDLEVELLLTDEPRDSMVICTPFADDPTAFYYNRKVLAMRARGGYRVGAEFYEFGSAACGSADAGLDGAGAGLDGSTRADKNVRPNPAFGLLDWGRGVWTYDNVWYWAAAQGEQDGHTVGLNLGYGFGDTSAASENMVFVDGVAHKLGDVDFGIPLASDADGRYDYLRPWHMTDDEGRLDLVFYPQIDRVDDINVASVVQSNQHQVFGTLSGSVVLDDGRRLEIHDLRASAEHIHNRY
jgi:hypothetical protein